MPFYGDFTPQTVTQEVLDKPALDDAIHVDVLSVGAMAGTGLDDSAAERKGLIKNHWVWRLLVKDDGDAGQISFGFEVADNSSIASNEAQYARSSDREFSSDSDIGSDYAQSTGGGDPATCSETGASSCESLDNAGTAEPPTGDGGSSENSGSDEDEACNHPNTQGVGKSVSNVDRAIWPTGFMHIEHEMLTYNQPPPDNSTA
ncbi:hypothetical protein NMY22_g13687 [Coprinellus aureogranulatus]|nr:hypothetical protein NMY22_g13687 [Coprinellus aureogranulatus]